MQEIKIVGDELQLAGHAISYQELILITLNELRSKYDVVFTLLTHTTSLPTFQDTQYALMMQKT